MHRPEAEIRAVCKDNAYTWRNVLTTGKEYVVIRTFNSVFDGYPMIDIMCDDGVTRTYRANRFSFETEKI